MLLLRIIQFPITSLQPSSSRNFPIKRYKLIHHRSFQKVIKNTFWVKSSYMNMEYSIEIKQKWLFRGHPKLSKKSKNTLLGLKMREIYIAKVDQFLEMCMKKIMTQMGPCFHAWNLILTWPTTPELTHTLFHYFYYLFWFFIH